jgi:hypothetical protein
MPTIAGSEKRNIRRPIESVPIACDLSRFFSIITFLRVQFTLVYDYTRADARYLAASEIFYTLEAA